METRYFRFTMRLVTLFCVASFGYALYLQYIVGLMPCPMCIVQRYAFTAVAITAVLASLGNGRWWQNFWAFWLLCSAGLGAYTAAIQSWLQWFPPEFASCGRDFYGMVENLPLSRSLSLIFRGSGDCAAIDWTLWGLTIANYAFLAFVAIAVLTLLALFSRPKRRY